MKPYFMQLSIFSVLSFYCSKTDILSIFKCRFFSNSWPYECLFFFHIFDLYIPALCGISYIILRGIRAGFWFISIDSLRSGVVIHTSLGAPHVQKKDIFKHPVSVCNQERALRTICVIVWTRNIHLMD